jgi:hypothetical protein
MINAMKRGRDGCDSLMFPDFSCVESHPFKYTGKSVEDSTEENDG